MTLPTPGILITTALAVLAFVVAFYVLLARERKIPYITNFIFPPVGILFFAVFLAFVAGLIQPPSPSADHNAPQSSFAVRVSSSAAKALTSIALLCLFTGIGVTTINILRLYNRQVNFRDDDWWKSTRIVRWQKRRRRKLRSEPTYEHSPIEINGEGVVKALAAAAITEYSSAPTILRTIAICKEPFHSIDPKVAKLCVELVNAGWFLQYTACARHPFEFLQTLKSAFGNKWTESSRKIIVVDAYTPHFGFTDSIHEVKTLAMTMDGVRNVPARDSFAGVHTANAKAFNEIKKQFSDSNTPRHPTLLLYEGANALAELESIDQYRVFTRHVITSERMWGGMLTLFLEPALGSAEIDLLKTYADVFICATEVKSG